MWIFDRCGSYIDSPKWLNNKRIKTNPKNNDDMCFNCVATSALNHGEKKQRLHPRQTNRTGENFFRWYQKTITFSVQFIPNNKGSEKVRQVYI